MMFRIICFALLLLFVRTYDSAHEDRSEYNELTGRVKRETKRSCSNCNKAFLNDPLKSLPFANCTFNVGGCEPVRAGKGCYRFCQPIMSTEKLNCGNKTFIMPVVTECRRRKRRKIIIKGRVINAIEPGLVSPAVGITDVTISIHNYPTTFSTNAQGCFTLEYMVQNQKNPPKRLVLEATKNGYLPTFKVLLITDNIITTIRGVNIDMTYLHRMYVPMFYPSAGIELATLGNAVIKIPPGTRFKYKDGTKVAGKVSAILHFIDRERGPIERCPGELIAGGKNILIFTVFNLIFQDTSRRYILPKDPIIVQIVNEKIKDATLWELNDNGRWKQFSEHVGKQIENIQIVGHLRTKHIGKWINIGKLDNEAMCYVKLRVFEDVSFTKEVLDQQSDHYAPEIALNILDVRHPRRSMALLLRPLAGTRSPGQTCHAVRCTDIRSISGKIAVFVRETRGNITSTAMPAIPIPLNHPSLPASLRNKLTALDYKVDYQKTRASLNFNASLNGPFYTDEDTCKSSTPNANSIWFARRTPIFFDNAFGDKVCVAKVRIYMDSHNYSFFDSVTATSIWGMQPAKYATSTVRYRRTVTAGSTSIFRLFFCLQYRCSESGDLTKVYIKVGFNENEHRFSCDQENMSFIPNAVSADGGGYFVGSDEIEVEDKCITDKNYNIYAHNFQCQEA